MTILGKHTVDETRHLIRLADFRVDGVNKELIPALKDPTAETVKALRDWNAFETKWEQVHHHVVETLLGQKISNPLVPENVLPSETEFKQVSDILDELTGFIRRFGNLTGKAINRDGEPPPDQVDPDLKAFQAVDEKIKAGEAAAADAKKAAGKAASSNTGLLIGLGVAGVLGVVVATKIYL